MLGALLSLDVPWDRFYLFQVDERIAPQGHADRNLTQLGETLGGRSPLATSNILPMPVEDADPERAAAAYSAHLHRLGGSPPVLDLVHLGMGADGHTASLVPGDSVLDVTDQEVAVTAAYQGRRRMTLTFPCLNRARRVLWLMTGESKAEMLVRLRDGDPSIPAGRISATNAVVYADRPAAQRL
jgi:6-phosphogluconolactonase